MSLLLPAGGRVQAAEDSEPPLLASGVVLYVGTGDAEADRGSIFLSIFL